MTQQQTSAATAAPDEQGEAPSIPQAVEGAWQSMLAAVPDTEAGSGYERIFSQLAGAESIDDLNAPWTAGDMEQYADLPLTIDSISKSESTYGGGLPFFLVVGAVVEETGERVTVTTGSVNIVAQLVRAYAAGLFPVRARVQIAERPTAKGFYPQRLQFLPARRANGDGGSASA